MAKLARIWEDRAYTSSPIEDCWYADTVDLGGWPQLEGDEDADVAIIGGGFTGLNAALHLAEAGVKATVLEAQQPFWGASGRNGGFCCLGGTKKGYSEMKTMFGEDEARKWFRTERAAVEFVGDLIDRLGLDVDRHSDGETMLAHRPKDYENIKASLDETRSLYGVEPELIPPDQMAQSGLRGPFHGAMRTPLGFALNPRKYASGLAQSAKAAGATIYGESAVTGVEPQPGGGYVLRTKTGSIKAKKFIVATNGYSSDNIPKWMKGRYIPTQSAIIVTREMSQEELSAQGWTSTQMCYDTRKLLHYFRLMPNNRMLFGMRGSLRHTGETEEQNRARVRADFDATFPAWRHVETPYYWSGFVCLTRDFLPYAGLIPDMPGGFAAFAYHGNGVSMGSYSGALLADLVQGKTPEGPYPAQMRHEPRRFPLGRFRRLLMKPAYWAYAMKDR
ncbi:MAG: FAD-binding oxidoreductase [Pseudomonadota bacterium]